MRMEEFFRQVSYITIKLTNGCNLKCAYCNVDALTAQTPMMDIAVFKKLATLLIENSKEPFIGLEFHGGEPLLLSDEWYEEAIAHAKRLARINNKLINFPMVTNGTLLTKERLLKLTKLGIEFCVSMDGTPEINDLHRQGGRSVEKTLRMMEECGIPHGHICVLNPSNSGRMKEVMDWFPSVGVNSFLLNPMQPQGRGIDEEILTDEQLYEGYRQVIEHMAETNVSVEESNALRYVSRFVEGRSENPRPTCWEHECQAGKSYVSANVNGDLHACGTDMTQHILGNIFRDLDEDHYRSTMGNLHKKDDWTIRCFDCSANQICNYSCTVSDYNSKEFREYECRSVRMLWNYLCENAEDAYRIHATVQRRRQYVPSGGYIPLVDVQERETKEERPPVESRVAAPV